MRGFDVVGKGSATFLLRNLNYIHFKSVPTSNVFSVLLRRKQKPRIYIGLIFITKSSCYALSTMTNAMLGIDCSMKKQQWLRIQLSLNNHWGSESKAITENAVEDFSAISDATQ